MPDAAASRGDAATRLAVVVATAGGIGHLRPGPGTWASAVVAAGAYGLIRAGVALSPCTLLIASLAVAAIGVPAATRAARRFGRVDPSQVVIDEVLGQLLALACVPAAVTASAPGASAFATFVAFRLFDIAKPWPISSLERLPAGFGVMADDAAAGALAGLVVAATMG